MSHAVHCLECDEYVWPPFEAGGPGGQTEIAACRLALAHVRESGHTRVDVVAGCYYVGEGVAPTGFSGAGTDPDTVCVPDRSKLAGAVAAAARTLRSAADGIEDGRNPELVTRHLRGMATSVESHVTDKATE